MCDCRVKDGLFEQVYAPIYIYTCTELIRHQRLLTNWMLRDAG